MIERTMIVTAGIVALVALVIVAVHGALETPITGTSWDALLVPVILMAGVAVFAGVIELVQIVLRRSDPVWASGGAISIDDQNRLTLTSKRLFRPEAPVDYVNLDEVVAATWDIDMFDRHAGLTVQLWDRDPQLTLHVFGIMSAAGIEPLTRIPLSVLEGSPAATTRLQLYLEQRIEAGTLDCNFTPHDFEPIPQRRPPIAPGVSIEPDGRTFTYRRPDSDPHLETP